MAKKSFLQNDDDPIQNGEAKAAAVSGVPTLQEVDTAVFGGSPVGIPGRERQIANSILITQIIPDLAQPRRAIPPSVRRTAREYEMPDWEAWHKTAEHLRGEYINLPALLKGEGDAPEEEPAGIPLVDAFLDLVALAASIYRDKLTNPITVQQIGMNRYQIETGERRWQAYVMLYGALGEEQFSKIAARVVDKANVWKQATENNARRPLNAIGIARQLSLLMMDIYRDKDGISFWPYEEMVPDGESDRAFYAQVVDGTVYRVPKGMSERILQASGLKSRAQLSQYRALLDVSDDVWMQADEEDWPEKQIRKMLASPVEQQDMLTQVNIPRDPSDVRPIFHSLDKFAQRDPADFKPKETAAALGYISQMREWLDHMEKRIKGD